MGYGRETNRISYEQNDTFQTKSRQYELRLNNMWVYRHWSTRLINAQNSSVKHDKLSTLRPQCDEQNVPSVKSTCKRSQRSFRQIKFKQVSNFQSQLIQPRNLTETRSHHSHAYIDTCSSFMQRRL